jgi:hypothetical protein
MNLASYQEYGHIPSAVLSDGILTIPIWAVTTMTQTYRLPPIGSSGAKAIVSTHDDAISLSGVLLGTERFAWKLALETLAETSKRGGAMGAISGLVLVTTMTIRTDMQVQSLSFTASSTKREALDVSISLAYMPKPSALGALLDVASVAVGSLLDFA